jgi:hypothetical protein
MKMGMQDTGPESRKVKTDPGIAPPSAGSGNEPAGDSIAPAATPPAGDLTPVPPEDGLLSGLIAGENEAYFRRAKAAPASNGDGAAAFHGGPHSVSAGNPTPAPEAPVRLRDSVEKDIAEMDVVRASQPGAPKRARGSRAEEATDPDPTSPRANDKKKGLDPTVPNPAPRTPGMETMLAFGAAALAVGVIALLLVRGLTGAGRASASQATESPSAPVAATAAIAQPAAPPPSPPPPVVAPPTPPAPAVDNTPAMPAIAATPAAAAHPAKPAVKAPAPRATAPRAPASAGSPAALPPPKDDVKRSM